MTLYIAYVKSHTWNTPRKQQFEFSAAPKTELSSARRSESVGWKKATLPQNLSAAPVERSASWGHSCIIFSFTLSFPSVFEQAASGRPHKAPVWRGWARRSCGVHSSLLEGLGLNSVMGCCCEVFTPSSAAWQKWRPLEEHVVSWWSLSRVGFVLYALR